VREKTRRWTARLLVRGLRVEEFESRSWYEMWFLRVAALVKAV